MGLGQAKQPGAAIPHLWWAVEGNPFDTAAARALFQAYHEVGDRENQARLTETRRLLARAVPQAVAQENWFASAPAQQPPTPAAACRVVWEGPLQAAHSLGLVNRELCRGLLQRGHDVTLLPVEAPLPPEQNVVLDTLLTERLGQDSSGTPEVHVRFQWPPQPAPPPVGRWVVMQCWEFGSLPKDWLPFLAGPVDEVWVPTRFVADCFIRSGVPRERVQVIPLGVDTERFHPEATPLRLRTQKRYKFLFVGGTVFRKGIDVLLKAYTRVFTAADDVCLVVKDMGIGTFYRDQTAEKVIARYQAKEQAPEIEYLSATLNEQDMPGLYTACDCLVHPYRGEGFGLPIAEAMACGLPVVVTGAGAALDFCDDRSAYLLPARRVRLPEKRIGEFDTVDYPWLAEPDGHKLQSLLQHVVGHRDEARVKGVAGRQRIQAAFTWKHAVIAVEARLQVLRRQPLRRNERIHPHQVAVSSAVASGRQSRVSLCLIVKNEERNLPACLESVAELVDEIVVVDTGSTDATKEIAARFQARVTDFKWVDSFSAARNESLRHATGEWIFWMDADDRLDQNNREKLRRLLAGLQLENAAYSLKCLCLPDADTGTATVVDHMRLFRNDPALRWEHRVHEQILPALRRLGAEIRWADVVIHHAGYQDSGLRKEKLGRNLRLLELEYQELGDHPFTLFNLGSEYQELGRYAEAVPLFQRSLERSHPNDSIVRKLYALLVGCHRAQGQLTEALAACQEGRRVYPDDAELLFSEALLHRDQRDFAAAAECLQRLLTLPPGKHFASVDAGLRSYKARQTLGVIYHQQGKRAEAEVEWRAVVGERADFLPGWLALGDLYLAEQRWPELEEAARRLEDLPRGRLEATLLQARAELARQEFQAARQRLEPVIAEHPQALRPWVILSHVLLQEGRDLAAAERALRQVLALDPNHKEVRNNLAVLLRERQR